MTMIIEEERGSCSQRFNASTRLLSRSTISGYLNSVPILIPRLIFRSTLKRVSSIPIPIGPP